MEKLYEQIRVYGGLDIETDKNTTKKRIKKVDFGTPTIQSIVGLEFVYSDAPAVVTASRKGSRICQSLAGDGVICYAPKTLGDTFRALRACKQLSLETYCKCYIPNSQKYNKLNIQKVIKANEISTKEFKELLKEYLKQQTGFREFGERVIEEVDLIPEEKEV